MKQVPGANERIQGHMDPDLDMGRKTGIHGFKKNLHVVDGQLERNRIELLVSDTGMSCVFVGNYRILNIENEQTIHRIRSRIIWDLGIDICLLEYRII